GRLRNLTSSPRRTSGGSYSIRRNRTCDMIGKFNVYDFLADLLPGLLVLWCLEQILTARGVAIPIGFHGDLADTSMLLLFGFVTGLFLQRLGERCTDPILRAIWRGLPSGRWLLPDDTEYSLKNRVIELTTKYFGVTVEH